MMADGGDCPAMTPRAVEIVVGDEPERWGALGFTLDAQGTCTLGGVRLVCAGGEPGLRTVALRDLAAERPDGLALVAAGNSRAVGEAGATGEAEHQNGAVAVDHVVAFTDSLDRTTAALEAAGLPLRRVRRPPEAPAPQAFLPAGTLVLEVVETGAPPSLWGLVVVVADLDTAYERYAEHLGAPREATQPGRRIATVRREAGLSVALALMTPRG
jgi:hypothetical protein